MTRTILCAVLCALTVLVALATAAVQSRNRDRGIALDGIKRECDMLEAVNGDRCQRILAQDWKPIPLDPVPPKETKPADKSKEAAPGRAARTPLLAAGEKRSKP